ncbi:MAG TPA: hypothetical protein VGT78_10850 [Rhizomicrobium sp.]|nr:hypothetical protein [Rhizomicrobium sp.]
MPRIPFEPKPPDKVFSLATPNHLYYKLLWELQNLDTALKDKQSWQHSPAPYHAFNFAVTSAHLIDWVYATSDDKSRKRISDSLGNAPVDTRRKFRDAVATRYHEIYICVQIANGSKHYETQRHRDNDPNIGASAEWEYDESTDSAATVLRIRDGAASRLALDVFREAATAWDHLLGAWGYLEDRFVDGRDTD